MWNYYAAFRSAKLYNIIVGERSVLFIFLNFSMNYYFPILQVYFHKVTAEYISWAFNVHIYSEWDSMVAYLQIYLVNQYFQRNTWSIFRNTSYYHKYSKPNTSNCKKFFGVNIHRIDKGININWNWRRICNTFLNKSKGNYW